MTDREKVIKGLECCHNKNILWNHDLCPYHGFDSDCESRLLADTIGLIKEQEQLIEEITKQRMDNGAFD